MPDEHTYGKQGPQGYPELIDTKKGMTYVSDQTYSYWDPTDTTGNMGNDYSTYSIKFKVPTEGGHTIVTAFRSTKSWWIRENNKHTTYNGYVLTPNVRYSELTKKWYPMDEPTLDKAIYNRDIDLVDTLLEHHDNYSTKFLAQKISELLPQTPRKKRRKGNK